MNHTNHSATLNADMTNRKSKGRELVVLLIIGVIGAAGLLFVLNSGEKSAFSDNGPVIEQVEVAS